MKSKYRAKRQANGKWKVVNMVTLLSVDYGLTETQADDLVVLMNEREGK